MRIHIVDVSLELEKFPRLASVRRAVINPQHIRNFEIVCAGAVSNPFDGKTFRQIERVLGKRRNDRRARRRRQFAFDGRAISREFGKKFSGCGRRDGHQTVGASNGAGADVDFRNERALDIEIIDADRGADNVNDRIDRADFMEVNFVGRFVVHFTFGGG